MLKKTLIVNNRAGIHARPSALIAETANKFTCNVFFTYKERNINAKSIMGIISMGAGYKTELTITVDGPDEKNALDAFEQLFARKFEED